MDNALASLWAKTCNWVNKCLAPCDTRWHPLILHMLDVAATADTVLAREPEATRTRMAAILGMEWGEARPWLLLLASCHDLGKACPGFQCKWADNLRKTGLSVPRMANTEINHAFVSQIALTEILRKRGWPDDLAELVADAVGCHHGERASPTTLDRLMGDRRALGGDDWSDARKGLAEAMSKVFDPVKVPDKQTLTGPDFMLLSGLTSFSDWIGSNEDWFSFGTPEHCEDLSRWFQKRRFDAGLALDTIGWLPRSPLSQAPDSFQEVFGLTPRPLQQAVVDSLTDLKRPSILLVEAPMGEGKTEAAFFAHLELQRRFGHRGLYVALPTKSAIAGMCCAALGLRRGSDKEREFLYSFSLVRMTAIAILRKRVNKELPVRRLQDYHTVGGGYDPNNPGERGYITVSAGDGKPRSKSGQSLAVLTHRQYLTDAAFGILLEGDTFLLSEIATALADPKWGIWLGRKTCIPSAPVLAGLEGNWDNLLRLLKENRDDALRLLIGEKHLESFTRQEEVENFGEGRDSLPDAPVSFATERRLFSPRRVRTIQGTGSL